MRHGPQNLVLHDYARYFFILAIAVVLFLFFWTISPFFNVLIYAALVAVVFWPIYRWFLKLFLGHSGFASLMMTLIVVVVVITPLSFFTVFLAQQAVDAYQLLDSKLLELDFQSLDRYGGLDDLPVVGELWAKLSTRYGWEDLFENTRVDVVKVVQDLGEKITSFLVSQSGNIVKSVGDTLVSLLIFLLTTFFFFRDGQQLTRFLKSISPLPTKYENEIENKLRNTTYAIVIGNFGTAILQGLVGAIGFTIAGVDNVIFWGTIMAFTSLIPYLGSALIWFPMGMVLLLQAEWAWGIFILLWGMLLVSLVDNVARPFLIGSRGKMHPLATFLVVLGGIFIFGLKGIIFGPLILSLTITVIHIYQLEYRRVLKT